LRELFAGGRADDAATLATIAALVETTGEIVDPHTAVGLYVASRNRGDPAVPLVTLATAHPAKFPDAVERATGRRPKLPARLAGLMDRPERVSVLPNDLTAVEAFVRARARISR
jgi:threonine synthase